MDDHTTSWAAVAIVFAIGYVLGAVSAVVALLIGAWLRRWDGG